jgi:twitching motility protein PilT
MAQQLVPKIGGKGRAMAMEVMIPNPAIRNLIREEKLQQIYSQMQVGQSKFGMQTMNQALLQLVERHIISLEDAMDRSHNLDEFKQMLSNSPVLNVKRDRPAKTA